MIIWTRSVNLFSEKFRNEAPTPGDENKATGWKDKTQEHKKKQIALVMNVECQVLRFHFLCSVKIDTICHHMYVNIIPPSVAYGKNNREYEKNKSRNTLWSLFSPF